MGDRDNLKKDADWKKFGKMLWQFHERLGMRRIPVARITRLYIIETLLGSALLQNAYKTRRIPYSLVQVSEQIEGGFF